MADFNDAGLLSFVQNEANKVERKAAKQATYGITYPQFINVDTSGGPFVPGVTYVSVNQYGKAGYINGNADDVPMSDADMSTKTVSVYNKGIGYGYGYIEAQQGKLYGFNVAAERALSARRAYEQDLESIVFSGDSTHGLVGFKGITSTQATSSANITAWVAGTTTAETIVQNLVGLIRDTGDTSSPTANRVLLDEAQLTIADTTFFSGGSLSATDYMKRKYPGIQLKGVKSFQNASSKNLYIAYRRSLDVVSLMLPMPHRFLPVREKGTLGFIVPGIYRTAGVNFKRKEDIAFAHS